jgi:mannose-6-phosphate isomerase-like protein (cupin superfamily)
MTPGINIYQEDRPWGNFRRFTENSSSTVKIITVKEGQSLSLQSHAERSEFWKIIAGEGVVEIDGQAREARIGDEYTIPTGTKHRLSARTNLQVLEIAVGNFSEDDITRYEDKYGRV